MLRPPLRVMREWADLYAAELLGPAMLVPALERIEAEVHARMVPDDAHSPSNRIILDGSATLGWRAEPARINADGCVRAGTCGLGCRYRAKQSALESWLPRALRSGARLFSDVRVERLRRQRDGPAPATRVEAVVLDRDTRAPRGRLTVDARTVVLAAGAVGTPVILQRSGLGGGAVGQYLRLHPTSGVLGAYPRAMYAAAGIPQSSVCTEGLERGDGFGFWIECPPLLPGLSAAAAPGFGPAHAARMADFERTGPLIVLVRDGADPRRSQGRVRARRGGGARIDYRLGDAERRTLAEGIHAAVRLHFAAGADSVLTLHAGARDLRPDDDFDWILRATGPEHRIGLFSAHVNGTCRMGKDPRTSACSPTGQRHGAPGIFIADGSIFPSAPSANPQATIMAAASLIAEML
jgi:choline dehydrogenase-like flavoprotein